MIVTRIFAFVWAIWGFIVFMTIVTLLTPLYAILLVFLGKRFAMTLVWWNYCFASPLILLLIGIRLKVVGKEKIKKEKTYVFVSNHLSWIDTISNASATPQPAKFLAKVELKKFPVFGFMVNMLGVMVDRKDKESRDRSFQILINELKIGNSIFIYPEGTRNRTPDLLKEFKDGAFKAAIAAQVPIVWQVLLGVKELNRNEVPFLLPGTVTVVFGEPIETRGMTEHDIPALHQRVKDEMLEELKRYYNV